MAYSKLHYKIMTHLCIYTNNLICGYFSKISIDKILFMVYNKYINKRKSRKSRKAHKIKEVSIMREITSINELMAELESLNYNYYGLRGAHDSDMDKIERGYLDCSYVWEHNGTTDEQLGGTCALGVHDTLTAQQIMDRYTTARDSYSENGTVLLIADKNQEYGTDENEVILGSMGYGADVVAIVRL